MILPFLLLLVAIAAAPFIGRNWWKKNYPFVAIGLGLIPVAYYCIVLNDGPRMAQSGAEYVSFIVLIGSLFVVSGGIHLRISGRSTPIANAAMLAIGAAAANLLGTTGASMVLIRPYLRANRYRMRSFHVVFFIFIVSNMGGALSPVGDPPLFLGYLGGVPFFWMLESAWQIWLLGLGIVLSVFFALDYCSFRKFDSGKESVPASELHEHAELSGLHNVGFLAVILAAAFLERPQFLREILMISAAAGSYLTTKSEIHAKNDFTFAPLKEVAILFIGIFATMVPALIGWRCTRHRPEPQLPDSFSGGRGRYRACSTTLRRI